ncbi:MULTISPECIES: MFS transporter [Streptomyces]|uniref:MFS transporter n=2 Tax=Streptomyces TaxID=1883 RepID=A0ABU4K062_9ACTN|nr:MFS transporter [Streptomyces roseolus]MDX2291133.1 MFS transporter [Streptomyces roseolus]
MSGSMATGPAPATTRPADARLTDGGYLGFVLAMGLSALGDAAWYVTLAWTVTADTGPARAGAVLALASLPRLVTLLGAGALVDSAGPRRVMVGADLARCAVMALAAAGALALGPGVPLLVAAAAGLALFGAFFIPASGALRAGLLPESHLVRGNALYLGALRGGQAAGGPLGGVLTALGGIPLVAAVNAVTYAVSALAVFRVRTRRERAAARAEPVPDEEPGTAAPQPSLAARIGEGLRAVAAAPRLRAVITVIGLTEFAGAGPINIGVALMANRNGSAAAGAGLLLTAFTVGAAAGFLLSLVWPARRRAGLVLALGTAGQTLSLAALAWAPTTAAALAPYAGLGLVSALVGTVLVSCVQRWAPEAVRGRVVSIQALLIFGAAPLGNLVIGVLVAWAGMTWALLLHALVALTALGTVLLVPLLREARLD